MEQDSTIGGELMDWGRCLEGFTSKHGAIGLQSAKLFAANLHETTGIDGDGGVAIDRRSLLLLAMDSAWITWLDDRFDSRPVDPGKLIDMEALIRAASEPPTTPEGQGFFLIRSRFARETDNATAYRLWLDTALDMFRAWHGDELLSQGNIQWSYTEYLRNGERSIAVIHFLATVALVFELDMYARMSDETFRSMLKNLSLAGRLENDLAGVDKDREEGEKANAVLLVEEFMPREPARAFVIAQRDAYKRLLSRDLEKLGQQDPFARIVKTTLATLERFYQPSA